MSTAFYRRLGKSNLEVSALGLGCWAIGGEMWNQQNGKPLSMGKIDDDESIKAIHCALDHGINLIDTADVYGAGHSEHLLAQALVGRRGEVIISTKFGNVFDETTRKVILKDGQTPSSEQIKESCRNSLRRLKTDYIDIYHLHIWTIPQEDVPQVLDTLDELVTEGLIRSYAWSTDVVCNARLFAERKHCTAVQLELNVLHDAKEMLCLCNNFDIAGIVRSPLAMGLLSDKYTAVSALPENDIRGREPEWMKYFKDGKPNPELLKKLDAVREVLTSNGRTLVQGALAWIWRRSERTIPIPGFKTVEQVMENAKAMEFGPLKGEQMDEIERLLER